MNHLKICPIGEFSCGKTSFVRRLIDNEFNPNTPFSLGATFPSRYFGFDGIEKRVCIWITGGQEKYGSMVKMYYRAVDGVFLMFDLNNEQSLSKVEHWYKDVNKIEYQTSKPVIFLIGNKSDLQQRCSEREILKISKKLNKMPIYYCSALNGNGCDTIFNDISNQMAINELKEPMIQMPPNRKHKLHCLIE